MCDVTQGGHGGNRSSDEAEQERAAAAGGGRANMHSSQSRGAVHQRSARPDPGAHQPGYDAGTLRYMRHDHADVRTCMHEVLNQRKSSRDSSLSMLYMCIDSRAPVWP